MGGGQLRLSDGENVERQVSEDGALGRYSLTIYR